MQAHPVKDYIAITEVPGTLLNTEQIARMRQRYALAMQLARGRRVLEVACGAGNGLAALATVADSVVGLDYSTAVLAVAQGAQTPVQRALTAGDAQQLPFATASFDLLLNFEAIYYLADPLAFLREAQRVLSPGGTLLLCTSNPEWPNFVAGALTTRYPTLVELQAWLAEVGFQSIRCHGALPATTTGSRGRLRTWLRKRLLQSGIIVPASRLGNVLKQVAYGKLTVLPANLSPATLEQEQQLPLIPLPADRPDRVHRVLYLQAQRA